MPKILVTGGSGFIGSNTLLSLLKNKNNNVLNIDIKPSKIEEIQKITYKIDINDYTSLRKIIIDFCPDYIIHLAARTDLNGMTIEDYSANTKGVYNLMQIIKDLSGIKKVVITSSMLVCHSGYQPKSQFDYNPTTIYGESKVETEKIVWNNQPQCDWAIVRPTSIWGPYFGIPYRSFFDLILSHKYFHIGNKSCTKTYGYIGNVTYQIEHILFNSTSDKNHKIFYLGDHPAINIEDWANEIAQEIGTKIIRMPIILLRFAALFGDCCKLFGINFPMTSFRLKNMTTDNIIDLSETYKIAPTPPYSRIEGIKETLNWLYNNKND